MVGRPRDAAASRGRFALKVQILERGEGTAGKLLRDTLLYNDLRNVVTHVDSVLADLKANPRKYINLSIF